ncbi:MAG TPA: DUF6212 domain-containing protein [Alphaproteobacteria bacterium]|nr:DUF6212 domain-containing protein [Alphaproteobacteria bacterium]
MTNKTALSTVKLEPPPRRRVCFITTEFHGLFRNGGIGTANTGLALALAHAGFDVTVTFSNADQSGPRAVVGDFWKLKAQYAKRGITLDFVAPPQGMPDAFNDSRSASYAVFLYLQRNPFDVVLFNDNGGQAFYSLQAKHAGVFPDAPQIYVVTHGPYDWVYDLNAVEYESRSPIIVGFMERRSAELADILISPSQYLMDWMAGQGWTLPERNCVVQNVIGVNGAASGAVTEPVPFDEIVFFGRQEIRKGLELFCDAIDLLHGKMDLSNTRVTFMGKFGHVAGLHSGVYLVERARKWRTPVRMLGNYDQAEALDYLRRPGVLAIIPSLAENSPCVVVECLELRIPFLATEGGGTPELVAKKDRERCLFPPVASDLASRIETALRDGHPAADLAIRQERVLREWVALLNQDVDPVLRSGSPATTPVAAATPRVSICFLRANARASSIAAIARQIYPNIEIVYADAEGREPDDELVFCPHPVRSVAVPGGGRAAARNAAAAAAKGEYLLFVDEPTVTMAPECVERLVAAAMRTKAEIVTCLPAHPDGGAPRWAHFPIGACVELGAFEACFGGPVIMASAKAFRQRRGFSSDCDEYVLNWAFLASSVLAGARLEVVPLILFEQDRAALMRFDAGTLVRGHRDIFRIYGDRPASMFFRSLEAFPGVRNQHLEQSKGALDKVGGRAQEIAIALSKLDPGKPEADRAFIDYCCERRMIELAIDFAVWNGKEMLNEVVNAAGKVREAEALAMIGQRRIVFPRKVDLTEALSGGLLAISPLHEAELRRPAGGLVSHPAGFGVQLVKADGGAPAGSKTIVGRVKIDGAATRPGAVSIAVAEAGSRLTVTEDNQIVGNGVSWSGWVAVDEGETTVRLALPEAAADISDLYFLSRTDARESVEAVVNWLGVEAIITVDPGRNGVDRRVALKPVHPDVIRNASLVTDVSDFPFPVLTPGRRMLTHPVPGRPLLVRLADALPPGTQGLRCSFSLEHEQAHAVDFGVWVGNPASEMPTEAELQERAAFSGWTTVRTPFEMRNLTMRLDMPLFEPADIYLTVRVTEAPDVYFCHAYWHELSVIEAWSDALVSGPSSGDQPPLPLAVAGMAVPDAVADR